MRPTNDGPPAPAIYLTGFSVETCGVTVGEVRAAALAALSAQGRVAMSGSELSITALGDDEIAELNRRWLDRSGATDVIAFGLGEAPLVCDIYVSVDRARAQATEHGLPVREELLRLVIHGVLHAVGYDHPDGPERDQSDMFGLQERVLRRLLEERPGS